MSQAVLLVNLGSPDSTDVADVKRYLHEFLTDERVIDVPFVRKVIVPLIILNTRPKKSAEAYASIWTDQGSPLIATSVHQQTALQDKVAPKVYLAMRYGNPAIEDTIRQIRADGVDSLLVIPLYPQYAMSSYETVVVKVMEAIQAHHPDVEVDVLQPFYNDPDYLDVLTESIRSQLPEDNELLLFSFHGIPERHLRLSDPSHSHCLCVKDCCKRANPAHATCYRHQCIYTAKAVTERLELAEGKSFISFQSRLGRDPWLSPATDATLERLAREGIKKVRVVCPAFVTDCLETLEEIAEEGKEIFMDAGGEDFALIPCLNESEAWIAYLEKRVLHWVEGQPA